MTILYVQPDEPKCLTTLYNLSHRGFRNRLLSNLILINDFSVEDVIYSVKYLSFTYWPPCLSVPLNSGQYIRMQCP